MKKITRKSFLKICGVSASMLALAACGETASSEAAGSSEATSSSEASSTGETGGDATAIKVAAVLGLGGLGDKSFNDDAALGLERAKEEYGIEYQYVEPKEIAEFEGNMREFARSGEYALIIGIGFDQADAISIVAEEFPEQKFLIVDGTVEGMDNVSSVAFHDNEKTYLVGTIAGLTTTANKVGFVGGMDIPLINGFYAGYMCGVASVNPECEVLVKYVGAWDDANTGKELALSLYNEGCDIVMAAAGSSGLGVFSAAAEAGALAIGADVNQIHIDPSVIFLSAIRAINQVVVNEIGAVVNDAFVGGHKIQGLADGAVTYTVEGSEIETPQEYIDAAEQARQDIIDGTIVVPNTIEDAEAFIATL